MRLLNRFLSITALLIFSYSLVLVSHTGLLAHAQEPSPFEIRIIPQAEYAVSGQPLTYTVLVTNVSQVAVQDALVRVKVPAGTILVAAISTDPDWYSNNPPAGVIREEAIWHTPNVVRPGEVIALQMVVKPISGLTQEKITNETSSVEIAAEGGPMTVATGIPIQVPVFTPTPAPSATSTATINPTVFVSPTYTATPRAIAATVPTPDATSVVRVDTAIPIAATRSTPILQPSPKSVDGSSFISFILIGVVILGLVGGLIWLLRKK